MLPSRVLLAVAFASQAHAFTYWIDGSCAGKVTEATISEVKAMGKEGSSRLRSGSQEMADQFKLIFKVDKTDSSASRAIGGLDAIAGMSPATDQKSSDVRIYCDNDPYSLQQKGGTERWIRQDDVPGQGKKKRNSRKDIKEAFFYDQFNFMARSAGHWGCQDGKDIFAITWITPDDVKGLDHNPKRAVISMCTTSYNQGPGEPKLLSDIPAKKDIVTDSLVETFEDLVSMTLFHELCHTRHVLDIPGRGNQELTNYEDLYAGTAAGNANECDSYAFLGLSGLLNARNVKFSVQKADQFDLEWIMPPKKPDAEMVRRAADTLRAFGDQRRRWLAANAQRSRDARNRIGRVRADSIRGSGLLVLAS